MPLRTNIMLLMAWCVSSHAQYVKDPRKIEAQVQTALDSAYSASVQIVPFDTIQNRQRPGVFSGVVVSAQGHILTVAHATTPNAVYQVMFPDGAKHIAIGKGRMAIKQQGRDLDMAMIKILRPGTWPYAKMVSNTGMKAGQLCLSISFPGSYNPKAQPNIRVGRINDPSVSSGYFETSCKMEPGDSGGGLFDGAGRLLGLHSWIKRSEDQNFEVPVDLYKKYWTALNRAEDYKELPEMDDFRAVPDPVSIPLIAPVEELVSVPGTLRKSIVMLESKRSGKPVRILATVIEAKNAGKRQAFLISKSSMVADSPLVSYMGNTVELQVLERDRENDLVLLMARSALPKGIPLKSIPDSIALSKADLGKFLVSGLNEAGKKVGVLSSIYTRMPLRFSVGYFGANARFIDEKITITDIAKGGAASNSLQLNDQVTGIGGVPISRPPEYGAELMKHLAGDSLTVDAVRAGQPIQVRMYLPAQPGPNHVASQFEGGRSARSDGFARVLVHDAAVTAGECGGPVFDVSGTFLGINIARHSRTSTVIMPADVVKKFIVNGLKIKKT